MELLPSALGVVLCIGGQGQVNGFSLDLTPARWVMGTNTKTKESPFFSPSTYRLSLSLSLVCFQAAPKFTQRVPT